MVERKRKHEGALTYDNILAKEVKNGCCFNSSFTLSNTHICTHTHTHIHLCVCVGVGLKMGQVAKKLTENTLNPEFSCAHCTQCLAHMHFALLYARYTRLVHAATNPSTHIQDAHPQRACYNPARWTFHGRYISMRTAHTPQRI